MQNTAKGKRDQQKNKTPPARSTHATRSKTQTMKISQMKVGNTQLGTRVPMKKAQKAEEKQQNKKQTQKTKNQKNQKALKIEEDIDDDVGDTHLDNEEQKIEIEPPLGDSRSQTPPTILQNPTFTQPVQSQQKKGVKQEQQGDPLQSQEIMEDMQFSEEQNGKRPKKVIQKLEFKFSDSSDDETLATPQKKAKKCATMIFFKKNDINPSENKLCIQAKKTDDKYPPLFSSEIMRQEPNKKVLQCYRMKSRCLTLENINSIAIGSDKKLTNLLDIKSMQDGSSYKQIVEYEKNYLPPNVVKKKIQCNCKKTKCLKLYCDCFAQGEYCKDCNCGDCHNKPEFDKEREVAINQLESRSRGQAFRPKVQVTEDEENEEMVSNKGCNCKKSGCTKKYCECYNTGVKCSNLCKCDGCKNRDPGYLLNNAKQENSNNSNNNVEVKNQDYQPMNNQIQYCNQMNSYYGGSIKQEDDNSNKVILGGFNQFNNNSIIQNPGFSHFIRDSKLDIGINQSQDMDQQVIKPSIMGFGSFKESQSQNGIPGVLLLQDSQKIGFQYNKNNQSKSWNLNDSNLQNGTQEE